MKKILICIMIMTMILSLYSCKSKIVDDELAQTNTEQPAENNDVTNDEKIENEETIQKEDTENVEKTEPTQTTVQQTQDIEEPSQQQNEEPESNEQKTEEKTTEVLGTGILEYIDISKVAKLEFLCPGEALSKATLESVKTVSTAEDIKKVIDTLSQISYTEKEKLFEEGEYIIAEPTAYQLRLYDNSGKRLCYLDLKYILNNENKVLVKNYRYTVEDTEKIDALITENIRSNCNCFICTAKTLVNALDCEICKQAKNGKFCKCEK